MIQSRKMFKAINTPTQQEGKEKHMPQVENFNTISACLFTSHPFYGDILAGFFTSDQKAIL